MVTLHQGGKHLSKFTCDYNLCHNLTVEVRLGKGERETIVDCVLCAKDWVRY